jgi:glycosyltransferase involved in cell wall biosynthesis
VKISVIAWARYDRRPDLLAQHLGATVHFVFFGKRAKLLQLPVRYTVQALRTWRLLKRERPDVVFVQNPPILCPLLGFLYARRHGAQYVIDSHTGAFVSPVWSMFLWLHRILSRNALTTLVSNSYLKQEVNSWGCHAVTMGFTPGHYPEGEPFPLSERFNAAVISSFDSDEPIDVVFEAAKQLPEVCFYVTGDSGRIPASLLGKKPDNCQLTGYLPYDRYVGLLRGADAIIDLTTNDHTLLMGAYEAVSLGTPLIVSDWPVLRKCFSRGTVHVPNTVEGLRDGVRRARKENEGLRQDILSLREELNAQWERELAELNDLLAESRGRDEPPAPAQAPRDPAAAGLR